MKYRSRTDIVAEILEAVHSAGGKTTKTRIMYKAFLSYAQLVEYLDVLTKNGLLSLMKDGAYKIEDKGTQFLVIHQQQERILKPTA